MSNLCASYNKILGLLHELEPQDNFLGQIRIPLEICKFGRANRARICQDTPETAPGYGYCAVHKAHYFGYKFHAVCTPQGIVKTFDISKASTHDIHYLGDLKTQLHHCVLVGDKGYLSRQYQHDLFDTAAIRLETPKRRNQLDFAPFNPVLRKARKREESRYFCESLFWASQPKQAAKT